MIDVAVLRAAGLTAEQIVSVIEAEQAADREVIAAKREAERIRKQIQRACPKDNADIAGHVGTDGTSLLPLSSPPSPSPVTPSPSPPIIPPFPHSRTVAVATRPIFSDPFEDFWKAYPKRDGSNPKHPAKTKFVAAVKSGTEPAAIIAGAGRYAAEASAKGQVGTPYVMQASTWLTKRCWADYAPIVNGSTGPPPTPPREFPKISQDLIEKFAVWWTPAIPESVPPEQWQSFQQELKNGKANSGQAASVVRGGTGVREGQAGFL